MADAISIEATNKVRVSLGMKPLPVPGQDGPTFKNADDANGEEEEEGSTLESRQAQGYENWQKAQEEAERKKKSQARNEAIKKARDLAQMHAKLEGKGLGDESDEELDTRTWLIQQKKRQKKLDKEREKARKMEEELRAREEAAYTSKDLAGVKVAHEVEDFDLENGEQVLTLKDTTIDENEEEGDELENLELREKESRDERLAVKKKKPIYNPNDFDDESGEKKVLAQYDEVIDGKKRKRFTLDAQGSTAEEREAKKQSLGDSLNSNAFSLEMIPDMPISDYQEPKEVSFKKPKKKKAKTTRKKASDDDDDDIAPIKETNGDAMEVDDEKAPVKSHDVSFVDDDDLQASLAKQRREALKKRKATKPEDIARRIREEASATPAAEVEDADESGELVINEASQFLANIQKPEERARRKSLSAQPHAVPEGATVHEQAESDDEDEDVDMDRTPEEEPTSENPTTTNTTLTATGLEDEASLDQGIGNTLNLLRQRGLVDVKDSGDLNALHRDRQRFLHEKQQREEAAELKARQQRERDRASGKLDRMSAREREEYARWENKQRDQAESRQAVEIFNREYKPVIEIRHVDEHGRQLTQKEAFKHLSHQFHGKGSGKKKTEKHIKKIEEEKARESQSVLDSGQRAGLNTALGATAKKNKQAGVRLA